MTTFTKSNAHVEIHEEHRHLAGKPDGARWTWRSYLVTEGRKSGCHHTVGHRSRAAAETCGDRRYKALPDGDPLPTTAGGLPR